MNNHTQNKTQGLSTAAGIPDFRTPGTGLYDNLQKYDLPEPTAVFDLEYFMENPRPFTMLAKELYPGNFKPTLSHYFVKLLDQKGLLLRNFTQNVDTLERVAGIDKDRLVEAHGSFAAAHCVGCKQSYSATYIKEEIFADRVPTCSCGSYIKPDIVFFGEQLPRRFFECVTQDMPKCDLLIVIGTSLKVAPFNSLIDRVADNVPRLLVNREKVGESNGLNAMMAMLQGLIPGGFKFDSPANKRDLALLGDCDDGVLSLAERLGWKDELLALRDEEWAKLEASPFNTDSLIAEIAE